MMKNKKSIIRTSVLLASLLLTSIYSKGQTFSSLNSHLQKVRIGLVDEFFDRFNGKTVHPDIPAKNDGSRMDNLLILFDLSQFLSKDDPRFIEAREMMNVVIKDSAQIHFSDSTWAAIAHCKGTLEGKSVKFDLYLTVQHRRQKMYKWVISRAEGDIFNIAPRNNNEKIMLNPDDHETNFISLKRMTSEQPFNVKNFMSKGFDYDMTSVFTYLIYNKKLKIDYVDDLEFVFTQIPGYIFHVKYFERENTNSGWLISNFYESTKDNKDSFLRMLHPQYSDKTFVVSQNNVNDQGSISNDSVPQAVESNVDYKDMFYPRLWEKLAQLNDYISFMQRRDTIRAKTVYKSKLIRLFAENSKIALKSSQKDSNMLVTVPEFCEMLINRSIKIVNIDSICIPLWDDKINSVSQETNRVELASSMCSVKDRPKEITESNYSQKLFAYKEDTEDGIEWIPVFGDMVVKIK